MNRHAIQLIARGAINRMGNMLYDYGNSVWLASMGTVGKDSVGDISSFMNLSPPF